ncbi:MAG: imelysin family protein [Bacteroidota bacterium]
MKYRLIIASLALSTLCLIVACNKDDEQQDPKNNQELIDLRLEQLATVDRYAITPLFAEVENSIEMLGNKVDAFSANPTIDHLTEVQQSWIAANLLVTRLKLYDFYDQMTALKWNNLTVSDKWPISKPTVVEEALAQTSTTLDANFIKESSSINFAPFPIIEYLLFDKDPVETLTQLQNQPRRMELLRAAKDYLLESRVLLQANWEAVKTTFLNASATGFTGGQNRMTNVLLEVLRETIIQRLVALEIYTNFGTFDPLSLENHRSGQSLALIETILAEWTRCFYADYGATEEVVGFDDYLTGLNQGELLENIGNAITDCNAKLAPLSNLEQDIINNTAEVEALLSSFQNLDRLLYADLVSVMCIELDMDECDCD